MIFVDHISLMVSDVNRTERFYTRILGNPIRQTKNSVAYDAGDTKIFFKTPYDNTSMAANKDQAGMMNHFAIGCETEEEFGYFKERMDETGIAYSEVKADPHSGKRYIWLNDPDGFRVEFILRGLDKRLVTL